MPRQRDQSFPPLTTSCKSLLIEGSDDTFREVVRDLVDFSIRLALIREALARHCGLTPPQYKVLMELAHWRGSTPTVSAVAWALHVTLPFITTEVNRMVRSGFIKKSGNQEDRRRVDLALTNKGRTLVDTLAPKQRAINDALFGELSKSEFRALGRLARKLLAGADVTLAPARTPPQAQIRRRRSRQPDGGLHRARE